ncbi:MAG TPA: hypothetical protein VGJ05_05210 [Fimbriiglobus sp.]|jgi:hypothetical protein
MTPMPAKKVLDAYFLDARSRLLDLAAAMDRIDRGAGDAAGDPRVGRIREALAVLAGTEPDRAARVQQIFSLAYDPTWPRPIPKN